MNEWELNIFLQDECVACDEPQVWKVESVTENDEYLDGKFKTFHLVSVVNC